LDPANIAVQSNWAWALQRRGDSGAALAVLDRAAGICPDDAMARVLLADMRARQSAAADAERQAKIAMRVGELADAFRSNTATVGTADPWSARPVTVSLMPLDSGGVVSAREGEEEFFRLRLAALLQEAGRVQVVERSLLDGLLAELQLSASGLVQPGAALRLGRILAARVIASGSLRRMGPELHAHIRLTDTETTALKGTVSVAAPGVDELSVLAAEQMAATLRRAYPLRGQVRACEQGRFILGVGADDGVHPGMVFSLLQERSTSDGQSRRYRPAGRVTVVAVQQDTASAEEANSGCACAAGMKIEQQIPEAPACARAAAPDGEMP
jgi:hypothetical protein